MMTADGPSPDTRRSTLDDRPFAHPAIETAMFGGSAMLFDRRNAMTHELNPTATAVWMLLDGVQTIQEIVDDVIEIFSAPTSDVTTAVCAAVDQFDFLGLLSGSREPDRPPALETKVVGDPIGDRDVMARPPDT